MNDANPNSTQNKDLYRTGRGERRTKPMFDFIEHGFCSICCTTYKSGTCPKDNEGRHPVICVDLGEGKSWYCSICFDRRISTILSKSPSTKLNDEDVEVDDQSVTIGGVQFDFT